MKLDAATLPNDPEELKSLLRDQEERYRSRVEYLEEKVRLLTQALFGKKSEKRPVPDEDGPRQLHMFHMFNEAEALVEQEKEPEPLTVPAHTRRKPKRKPLPAGLPRVEVIHDIPEAKKVCACGAHLSRMGEEVNEKLDMVPARIQVIRNIRPKYACKACEGVEGEGPAVTSASLPPEIIPKGMATPGLLAHIAVSKYQDALPLYRQEKIFSRQGIDIKRSTMAGWMVKSAEACSPLMALLQKELLSGPLINVDETPVQVLNEAGRQNTAKSYMWVFRGGDPEKPVLLFRYHPTRSVDVPREILRGYEGYLQSDALPVYDALGRELPGIVLVGCFAHARRNFVKVVDARGHEKKKKIGSAEVAIDYIRKLYAIEKIIRQKNLSPAEIVEVRREKSKPLLDQFREWVGRRATLTPPKGLLGKALNYTATHWSKLVRYIENGHITPDNNLAENAIRPFVLGRKNWLFHGHPNGAHAASTLYSLIETAKACGLEPYGYLRLVFEKIPHATCEDDHRALLPQNIKADRLSLS